MLIELHVHSFLMTNSSQLTSPKHTFRELKFNYTIISLKNKFTSCFSAFNLAPTNTPTSIQVSYTLDQIILSWNPPDWDHRHGIFESYEIKCYRNKPSMNVSHVDVDEKTNTLLNDQLKSQEDQHFNVTLLNSRVQWPISAPNDLLNIIPWPSGQIRLNYPNDFNYKHGEIDSRQNNNDNTVRYGGSNNNNIYACVIRAVNVYGFGPWSTEKIILPKKPCKSRPFFE